MTELIVTVKQGQLRGKISEDYRGDSFNSFCGIPYAKAPVGDLRFKAPQPPEPWTGVRDATKEGPECPSLDMYFGYFVGNEDNCLTLNVHTKEIPTDQTTKKPVMVWIHGGAFLYGSNKSEQFGPGYLMSEDIVLVSINYRLGVLGFLSLEDPSLGVPGNAGLKDQAMALKWVQENIESFGGDSKNVTIFGESAGAASVHYLTLSPLTKGLFQKAIMQSGCSINIWAKGKRNAQEVAKCLGYKDVDENVILKKLMKESPRTLVNGVFKIEDPFYASTIRPVSPVIETPHEGAFLSEDPIEIMKSGRSHQIPIIIGYNSLEGMFFELVMRTRSYATLPKNLELQVPFDLKLPKNSSESKAIAEKIKKFYYNGEDVTEDNVGSTYLCVGDIQFVYGIQKSIQLQKQNGTQPIYVYRNALDGPLNYFKKFCQVRYFKTMILCNFFTKMTGCASLKNIFQSIALKLPSSYDKGVSHADDLFYLFTTFFSPKISPGSMEDVYIQRFVKLWTNFAKFGKPTPEADEKFNKVIWNPIEDDTLGSILEIDEKLKIIKNVDEDRMKFWDDVYKQ